MTTILLGKECSTFLETDDSVLQRSEVRLVWAETVDAFVPLALEHRPDLVVLDLMLPGMDGLEVCTRIQRDRWTPVLMLTARTEEADKVAGFAVGADEILTAIFPAAEQRARLHAMLVRTQRDVAVHPSTRMPPF